MLRNLIDVSVIVFGSLLTAIGFNLFFIPHLLLNGGISGVAMLIGYFTDWSIGLLFFVINIPIMIWGYLVIGKRFIMLSMCSVVCTTLFMFLVSPVYHPQASILGAVFGGVIVGIASGISLRVGGSTGGFDIIGSILTRKWDFPLGSVLFALNAVVVLFLGYFKDNWDLALYSMLAIYITSKVIDAIHIRYLKVTAFIITKNKAHLLAKLLTMPRGVTVIRTSGAYTQEQHDMLMTVTTKYELIELKKIVKELDPHAFVNIVETVGVVGQFQNLK